MKNNNHPRVPSGWLYTVAIFVIGTFLRLRYRIKVDNEKIKGMKGPFLVLSNHQSNYDFAVTALAMWPLKMNYLVSTYFMNSRLLGFFLKKVGAIPKTQFIPDSLAIINAYRAVVNNQSVIIFPEGQVGFFGASVGIDKSIAKLIKRFRVTVLNVKLRGGYLTNSKWSKKHYPARIEANCDLLLTKEQVLSMTEDEIYQSVIDGLTYNDFEWQREKMIPSKKKRMTEGLQNILFMCPKCKKEFAMTSSKDKLCCDSCGYQVRLNRYGFFEADEGETVIYDNAVDWYKMQQEIIREKVENNILPFTTNCNLMSTDKKKLGYFMRGKGKLTVDRNGLFYEGTRDNEPYTQLFSIKTQSALANSCDVWGIDFIGEDCNYAFCPDDPRKMLMIVEIYAVLREEYESNML